MWPDYLGNLPTWGAFIAAATAAGFTWEALQRERTRDAAGERGKRRAQASLVAAWVEPIDRPQEFDSPSWVVKMANRSDLPIFGVRGEARVLGQTDLSGLLGSVQASGIPPAKVIEQGTDDPLARSLPLTMQGDSQRFARGLQLDDVRVRLTFTDCQTITWIRDYDGRLSEANLPEIGEPDSDPVWIGRRVARSIASWSSKHSEVHAPSGTKSTGIESSPND